MDTPLAGSATSVRRALAREALTSLSVCRPTVMSAPGFSREGSADSPQASARGLLNGRPIAKQPSLLQRLRRGALPLSFGIRALNTSLLSVRDQVCCSQPA